MSALDFSNPLDALRDIGDRVLDLSAMFRAERRKATVGSRDYERADAALAALSLVEDRVLVAMQRAALARRERPVTSLVEVHTRKLDELRQQNGAA